MKKLIALILLSAMLCLGVSGCGQNMVSLTLKCRYGDGDSFSLPLKQKGLREYPGNISFDSEYTLAELKDLVDSADYGNTQVITYLSGNTVIIEKTDSSQKTHYYCIHEKNGRYYFTDALMGFVKKDFPSQVFPHHLIEEPQEDSNGLGWDSLKEETAYPTSHTPQEFATFYEKLEGFTVSVEENTVTVRFEKKDVQNVLKQYQIVMTFSEQGVTFSFLTL